MNYDELSLKEIKKMWHGNFRSYVIGFLLCIALTGVSFFIVAIESLPKYLIFYTLGSLAIVQAIIQSIFFLHVGQEDKPRWESLIFYFMIMILLIVAVGSLWIMNDLNERVMETTHD